MKEKVDDEILLDVEEMTIEKTQEAIEHINSILEKKEVSPQRLEKYENLKAALMDLLELRLIQAMVDKSMK